ncbi:MAG: universal stress protein [Caldilineaceae bacterium]|nr:universal stress protein [Caldilineaceae bacterium]
MSAIYRKIMVTLDGSAFAAQALPHARSLAEKYAAELILFQVVTEVEPSRLEDLALDLSGIHEPTPNTGRSTATLETLKSLQQQAHELSKEGIRATPVAQTGSAAESIIGYASAEGVDLIVMSTHGRSGMQRWVYGSVADKVLRGATCPVLLVRLTV